MLLAGPEIQIRFYLSGGDGIWRMSSFPPGPSIDPLGRPVITAVSDNCFRTCYASSLFKIKQNKKNKFQEKTIFTTGETVVLPEWIIDDTCLVIIKLLLASDGFSTEINQWSRQWQRCWMFMREP